MKQILQNLGNGDTILADIPVPVAVRGHLLIRSERSAVSIGTERMLIDFGRSSLLEKARQQPARVKQVIAKAKTDGILPTLETIRSKLDQPIPLGYSNAGVVVEVGPGVRRFKPGDRVISNGPHSEFVLVPENLCAHIPDEVSFDEAAFTVVASIALQGTRLANPTFGETFVVTGLGLIGLITAQILMAQGCRVIGLDNSSDKCDRAKKQGVHVVDLASGADPVLLTQAMTQGVGVDGVIITASTKSNEPIRQAPLMCRKRGRIILIGVTNLELSREDFYEKEISFQVSCSYGPGRYDDTYESKGIDYPVGYVRWTEQRNFEAILQNIATGHLDMKGLVTHRFPFENAADAYGPEAKDALGLLLEYRKQDCSDLSRTVALPQSAAPGPVSQVSVGLIGAGSFTSLVMVPSLKSAGVRMRTIASRKGITSAHLGKKFGFERTTTAPDELFADPETNAIVITTRPDSHASFVEKALKAGKSAFVEKPLAINREQLATLQFEYERAATPFVMVGFNRRFSPLSMKMRELLITTSGAKSVVITVNAGAIPRSDWNHDPEVNGGRIIGEGCHFVDLARYLVGRPITSVWATCTKDNVGAPIDDESTITLRFEDGSMATVHYLASGHKSMSKERVEVFVDGKVLQLDNFRTLVGYGWSGFRRMRLSRQDKGHLNEVVAVINAIKTGSPSPIPWNELVEVTNAVFDATELIQFSP